MPRRLKSVRTAITVAAVSVGSGILLFQNCSQTHGVSSGASMLTAGLSRRNVVDSDSNPLIAVLQDSNGQTRTSTDPGEIAAGGLQFYMFADSLPGTIAVRNLGPIAQYPNGNLYFPDCWYGMVCPMGCSLSPSDLQKNPVSGYVYPSRQANTKAIWDNGWVNTPAGRIGFSYNQNFDESRCPGPDAPMAYYKCFFTPLPGGNVGTIVSMSAGTVSGWACEKGHQESINVDIYVGAAYPSGQFLTRTAANLKTDNSVALACGTSGSAYGFSYALDSSVLTSRAGQALYAYAIPADGSDPSLLSNSGAVNLPSNNSSAGASSSAGALVDSTGPALSDGTTYRIVSVASGQCLDVPSGSPTPGTLLQQYTCIADDQNQGWILKANADRTYSFISAVTKQALDFDSQSLPQNATHVQQYTANGWPNQTFTLAPSAGGYQISSPAATTQCLDVPAQTLLDPGTRLQTWQCLGTLNQAFVLKPF